MIKESRDLSIVFAGTSAIAIPTLEFLYENSNVIAVLTAPDKPFGRGLKMKACPVKEAAVRLGVKNILEPFSLDENFRNQVSALQPDLMVVYAYGKIFGPKFLNLFPRGSINLHPSNLPKYRGPAPLAGAILNQDKDFNISIQKIALKMDSGDIVAQKKFSLDGSETTGSLTEKAAILSVELLEEVWSDILNRIDHAIPQAEEFATYVSLLSKDDGVIDWSSSATSIEAKIRAYQPWPKCYSYLNGLKLFLYKASVLDSSVSNKKIGEIIGIDTDGRINVQCGSGILSIMELQLESKKRLDSKTFFNGNRSIIGAILGGKV